MRIVQLLSWKLKSIELILDEIKRQGFDTIQINPMQEFKEEEGKFNWWSSYQPLGFNLGNRFGTKDDLTRLCEKAHERNIAIVVDLVCNHVANKNDIECQTPSPKVDQEILETPDCFKERKLIENYNDRRDCFIHNASLPGIKVDHPVIRNKLFNYINELYKCGVKGLRVDSAKHIGLPGDGVSFFHNLKEFLDDRGMFAYGEFLGSDPLWLDEFCNYFDVLNGFQIKVPQKDKHVAFIESHDTYLNTWGDTKKFTEEDINLFYSLLTTKYEKTLKYVRAKYYPYNDNGIKGPSFNKPFDEINEFDFFDTSFLTDKNINFGNKEGKKLVLK